MYNTVLASKERDLERLGEVRSEFMSNLDLNDLDDNLRGRNREITLAAIKDYEDTWTAKLIDKDGRLSTEDLTNMRRHRQEIESVIGKVNNAHGEFMDAQREMRIRGDRYDIQHFEARKQEYLKEGAIPQDGWLLPAKVNLRAVFENVSRPRTQANRTVHRRMVDGVYRSFAQYNWTDDDGRDAVIADMMNDPSILRSIEEEYKMLPDEERMLIMEEAQEKGVDVYTYYAQENYRDHVLRSRTDDITDEERGRRTEPDVIDVSSRGASMMTIGQDSPVTKELVNLVPENLNSTVAIGRAINIETGQAENIGTSLDVKLYAYNPSSNSIIVQAERRNYETQVVVGGQPQYTITHPISGATSPPMTKERLQAYIAATSNPEAYKGVEPEPYTKTESRKTVFYELPINEYPEIIKGLKLPSTRQAGEPDRERRERTPLRDYLPEGIQDRTRGINLMELE